MAIAVQVEIRGNERRGMTNHQKPTQSRKQTYGQKTGK